MFRDITKHAGLVHAGVGRGCAYGDYDNDGDLDLLVSNNGVEDEFGGAWLLRNDTEPASNYLRVKTVGVRSNRDGIGAKVRVTAGEIPSKARWFVPAAVIVLKVRWC